MSDLLKWCFDNKRPVWIYVIAMIFLILCVMAYIAAVLVLAYWFHSLWVLLLVPMACLAVMIEAYKRGQS